MASETPLDVIDDQAEVQKRLNRALSMLVMGVGSSGVGTPESKGRADPKDLDAFVWRPGECPGLPRLLSVHMASEPCWKELLDQDVVDSVSTDQ